MSSRRYIRVRERQIDLGRILGIIGGAVALVSLFLPWILVTGQCFGFTVYEGEFTLWNVVDLSDATGGNPTGLYIVILFVALGGLISLSRPGGGAIVVLGWLLFAIVFARLIVSQDVLTCGVEIGYTTGFWVCVGGSVTSLIGTAVGKI